jgi:7,8-dihydropterin-6-yl-methyl-4-(beta-D-ribofuranosyl)aminobenzene 5'-phosphate synthase
MRMTVLIENDVPTDGADLAAEFGLSLLFDLGGTQVLFDTGDSGVFADNAVRLGLDIAAVDLAVLSHQHFDHGGGLARFLELNDHAPIYLRRAEHADRFSRFPDRTQAIGIDLGLLDRFPDRFVELEETTEITPGVALVMEAGSHYRRPLGNDRLFVRRDDRLVVDDFDHELTMVLHDDDGMVVVTGCSHSGVLNMIDAARARFPDKRLKAVVGGFHLIGLPSADSMALSRPEVEEIGREIRSRCDGPIFTGHCTGHKAFGVLGGVLGDQLHRLSIGATTEI